MVPELPQDDVAEDGDVGDVDIQDDEVVQLVAEGQHALGRRLRRLLCRPGGQ